MDWGIFFIHFVYIYTECQLLRCSRRDCMVLVSAEILWTAAGFGLSEWSDAIVAKLPLPSPWQRRLTLRKRASARAPGSAGPWSTSMTTNIDSGREHRRRRWRRQWRWRRGCRAAELDPERARSTVSLQAQLMSWMTGVKNEWRILGRNSCIRYWRWWAAAVVSRKYSHTVHIVQLTCCSTCSMDTAIPSLTTAVNASNWKKQ